MTIGNFDGMHRGHQAILQRVKTHAQQHGLCSTVMLFEPHPKEFFAVSNASSVTPARLMRLRDKCAYLAAFGIDQVFVCAFNAAWRHCEAETFIHQHLCEQLQMRWLCIGQDFRFGRGRQGDWALLQSASERLGYVVERAPDVCDAQGVRVSSSAVRQALQQRDLARAADLLGHRFAVAGRVSRGRQLGRSLGFPTLNIRPHRRVPPLQGIYAVTVHGLGEQAIAGVASWGCRPAVDGGADLLEVHCFDFDREVYGARVRVQFEHFIREEQHFNSLADLAEAMAADAAKAQKLL